MLRKRITPAAVTEGAGGSLLAQSQSADAERADRLCNLAREARASLAPFCLAEYKSMWVKEYVSIGAHEGVGVLLHLAR
jgi:hypothetical protein